MRILTILIMLIGISAIGFAQEDHKKVRKEMNPEERAEKMTDRMNEFLSLDEDQKEKISAINLAHAMEMEKIHEEMKALKKRAMEQREKTKSEIDGVLNEEQQEKFKSEREKHKEERERKRRERCCQEKE